MSGSATTPRTLKSAPRRTPEAQPDAPSIAARLESLLAELDAAHQELLHLSREHRRAISKADTDRLAGCAAQEKTITRRVRDLEKSGRDVIASIPLESGKPPRTIREAAQALPAPAAARVVEASDRLRAKVIELQTENRAVVEATRSMLAHMEGLIRQVGHRLSDTGTYTPRPTPARRPMASALDLRS